MDSTWPSATKNENRLLPYAWANWPILGFCISWKTSNVQIPCSQQLSLLEGMDDLSQLSLEPLEMRKRQNRFFCLNIKKLERKKTNHHRFK